MRMSVIREICGLMILAALPVLGGDSFVMAKPVWPEGETETMNSFFRFKCTFVARVDAHATLRVTAGYDYKAWLNGQFVSFGPARSAPGFFRVDECPLKVHPGENTLAIDVAGYNCNNFYLPVQTPFLQAEVLLDGQVVARTAADGEFKAYTSGRVRKVPRFSYQRTFAEVYAWPHEPIELWCLIEQPAKRLLAREWSYPDFQLTEDFAAVSKEKVAYDRNAKVKTDRYIVSDQPNYKYFKVEELEANPYYEIQRLKTYVRQEPSASQKGWYSLSENEGIVFEGKREYAGFPRFKVRCRDLITVYFTFDEFLQADGSVDQFRAETLGTIVWQLGKGEYDLEGFEPVALKCARILVVGGDAEVTAPSMRTFVSPDVSRASFACSDPAYSMIFEAAKASYAANAVDCLTDCPIRERAGWLGDTFFTGRASQWLTGSGRNEGLFLENFLRPKMFACDEEYRGLIPAVWPVDLMAKACFIPNYDMWFVLELEEYVRRSGNVDLAMAFRQRVVDLVSAFERRENSDGLLENLPGWVFVEWSHANSLVQDVNYPSNMMYAQMLDAVARLYGLQELETKAAKIRKTIRSQSLTEDGWYCDNAVRQKDGTLKLSGECTETCQYYAFFTGVATKDSDETLWRRLVHDFGPDRIKNAKWDCGDNLWLRLSTPIREGRWKNIWPANMIFGTCLRMELLSRDGRSAQVAREIKEHFLPMAEKTGTLWEHGDSRASCCHGFASIAAEYLYRDILGVKTIDYQARTIQIEPPEDSELTWCSAQLPLGADGMARIAWRRSSDGFKIDFALPDGWRRMGF